MSVVVVGIEQANAPLDLLERVSVPEEALSKIMSDLMGTPNFTEVVILSTCLRTECYAVVERFHQGVEDLQCLLAERAGVSVGELADQMTVLFDDAVAVHLCEVASGLRSAVIGETEVLGQVRRAGERAVDERAAGPILGGMFRKAVQTGRKVRTATAISRGTTSLAHVAVDLLVDNLATSMADMSAEDAVYVDDNMAPDGDVSADGDTHVDVPTSDMAHSEPASGSGQFSVVVVGAGAMGEAVARALAALDCEITVVNRSLPRARALAAELGARAVGLSALDEVLVDAAGMFVTTGATSPLITAEMVYRGRSNRSRPLVVVDLAVPRNVDPAVGDLDGVVLFDMDALRSRAAAAVESRRAELDAAEAVVHQEVESYRSELRARGAAPIVSALRGRMEELRVAELARHRPKAGNLSDEAWAEVEAVTRDVLGKLLHQPTVILRDSAGSDRGERMVESLRLLFDL